MYAVYRDASGKFCKKWEAVSMQPIMVIKYKTRKSKIVSGEMVYLPYYLRSRAYDKAAYEATKHAPAPAKIKEELEQWEVHAKLDMTKGKKGGKIELEAITFAVGMDKESAKRKLQLEIFQNFPELAFSKIKFFANSTDHPESEGQLMFRNNSGARWRQMRIRAYV